MEVDLAIAINEVIGVTGGTTGFRWAVNHSSTSVDSAPGATAPHQLTIKRKMEAPPIVFVQQNKEAEYFPGVFFEIVGNFPDVTTRGAHDEGTFSVKIIWVGVTANNTRPKEQGRLMATKLTDNIKASNKMGLSWASRVVWRGLVDDPFIQQLHLLMPDYYAGATLFTVYAEGITF